jgi:hypothetical protein
MHAALPQRKAAPRGSLYARPFFRWGRQIASKVERPVSAFLPIELSEVSKLYINKYALWKALLQMNIYIIMKIKRPACSFAPMYII